MSESTSNPPHRVVVLDGDAKVVVLTVPMVVGVFGVSGALLARCRVTGVIVDDQFKFRLPAGEWAMEVDSPGIVDSVGILHPSHTIGVIYVEAKWNVKVDTITSLKSVVTLKVDLGQRPQLDIQN